MQIKNKILQIAALVATLCCAVARADISLLATKHTNAAVPQAKVFALITANIDMLDVGTTKAQVIFNEQGVPDHILVFKLSNLYHTATVDRINIDRNYQLVSVEPNYQLTKYDEDQRVPLGNIACPDESTQFIVFAPANDGHPPAMQDEAEQIAKAAESAGLKTVRLTLSAAATAKPTRENYLNYMTCHHLVGNFATTHGYTNGNVETMVDDVYITPDDIKTYVSGKFKYKVTTFWDACLVFASPMTVVMLRDAQAQKFIAGITQVPLNAGATTSVCTMKKILANNNIKIADALNACWTPDTGPDPTNKNKWGINRDGYGSNYFGK